MNASTARRVLHQLTLLIVWFVVATVLMQCRHCEDRFFSDTRKGLAEQLLPKYTQIFPKPIKGSDEEQEVKPYEMRGHSLCVWWRRVYW